VIDPLLVDDLVNRFLREDIGFVDLTSTIMIDADARGHFALNAREALVVSGIGIAARVFETVAPECRVTPRVADGDAVASGTLLADIEGPARGILTAERVALNLLQHMSGIATVTARYVAAIAGSGAQLIDTRKTTPGLRALEKHAVECGGGRNHRLALDSGVMIKDNHIAVCGGLEAAIRRAKARVPVLTRVEVECDRLDQVADALAAGADILLLDNMTTDMLREAVRIVDGRIPLEASGGITLDSVTGIARTGIERISVGAITHSAPALDLALDWSTSRG